MREGTKNRRQAQSIADIIEEYHNRFNQGVVDAVPNTFEEVQKRLLKLKKEGTRLLVNSKDSNSIQSVVIRLDYVGKWWALGKYRCVRGLEVLELPFTFHYSDIVSSDTDVVVIPEGKVAFGRAPKEK